MPWSIGGYPGIERGAGEIIRGATKWQIRGWQNNKNHAPQWAVDLLAGYIEARLEAGQRVLAELRAYRPPPKKPSGFLLPDPVTGLDRRGKGHSKGRRHTLESHKA